MYISASITAIDGNESTQFYAKIWPVRVGDVIIYEDKEYTVTDMKQRIAFGQTQSLIVTMEHKANPAAAFK